MDLSNSVFPRYAHLSGLRVARQAESDSTTSLVGTPSVELLYLFLAFQLVAQTLLPLLVLTFLLSKSVHRHPTVISVCLSWIISGIVSSLLFYAGKHVGPEPPSMLCVSQAALLYGVVPMTSVAILALMYQLHLYIRRPLVAPSADIRTYGLLIAPYITFFCFATGAAFIAAQKPETVSRSRRFFYCSFRSPITKALSVVAAVALFASFGYAASIGISLYKNWRELRHSGSLDLQLLGRVALFELWVFIGLIVSAMSVAGVRSPFPDLFAASVGTVLFIVLGSHPSVWRLWLRRPKPLPPSIMEKDTTYKA